jgi:hypothetical protein
MPIKLLQLVSIKHRYASIKIKLQLLKNQEAVFISYVLFTNDCYRFYDDQNMPRFDDRSHRHLFDFVSAELPQIELLLEKFFSTMFDFKKLELKEDRPRYKEYEEEVQFVKPVPSSKKSEDDKANEYLKEIISILESSHPYYRIGENAINAAEDAIIDYFHLHSSYNEDVLTEEKHKNNVSILLSTPPLSGYVPSDKKKELFRAYCKCYDQSSSVRRALKKGRECEAKSAIKIIAVQQRMRELLFRILDISVPIINRLSIFDRIWLYKKLQSKKPFSSTDVQKLSTCPAKSGTILQSGEYMKEVSDFITAHPLRDGLHYDFAPEGNIKLTIFEDENQVYEQFGVEGLEQLLQWEFIKMVQAGTKIKKCACCGRYFLVKDGKNNYCDRVFKGDKTCLDIGPDHRFKEQKKNDAYYTACRKAISRNQARVNSKTKPPITKYSFKYWRMEARRKLAGVYADGEKRSGSFFEWLDMTATEITEKFEEEFKYLCEVYADEEKCIESFFEWWDTTDKKIIVEKFKYWCGEAYPDGEKHSKSFFEWFDMTNKEIVEKAKNSR